MWITRFIAILALLLPVLAVTAQAQDSAPRVVIQESVKDAGAVPKGHVIKHVFTVKNEGNADLEIIRVQPGCGCTVVEYDEKIAPGKEGSFKAEVDTSDFAGPIAKTIVVLTNDPDTPRFQLTVKAKVEPYLAVLPGFARYNFVQGEAEGTLVQTIWATDGQDLKVLDVESPFPYLRVTYRESAEGEQRSEGTGKQWRVETTLDTNAPVGPLAGYVVVKTNHSKQSVVKIPVSGFVRPILAVTPPTADFGQFTGTENREGTLLVVNFATDLIRLTEVAEKPDGIEVEIKTLEDGRRYQVLVTTTPEMPQGELDSSIRIKTDSTKKPFLDITIKGTVL